MPEVVAEEGNIPSIKKELENNELENNELENNEELLEEHALLKEVYEKLTEEKWTRTTISNYNKSNFEELDKLIEEAANEGISESLRNLCVKHVENSPKSIMGLYIAGILTYEQEIIDDNYIYQIISLFKEGSKWQVVEYLAEKALYYGENKFALKMLEEAYEKTDNKEGLLGVWKRITKVDYESGDTPCKLGDYYENEVGGAEGEEQGIFYYKMALKRYSKSVKSPLKTIEEIWVGLLSKIENDLDYFIDIQAELVKTYPDKTYELLGLLLIPYLEQDDYDSAILILKKMLLCKPQDRELRERLIEVLSLKYGQHNQLENYLERSGIKDFSTNLKESLETFQKYIVFDAGRYVHHRSWGIGVIKECREDYLIIDFHGKQNHKMSLKIVLTSLKSIGDDHLWIRKQSGVEEFAKMDGESIKNTLIVILKSYNNIITMKEIKREMLDIIPASSWTKWWNKAKQVMKTSSLFGNSLYKRDLYFLRDKPLSFEEENYSNFESDNTLDGKIAIMLDYLKHSSEVNTEAFQQMINYFVEVANNKLTIDEKNIKSFLLLRKIKKDNPSIAFELKLNPYEVLSSKRDLINSFSTLGDSIFKKDIIDIIKKNDPEWEVALLELLKDGNITKSYGLIIEQLVKAEKNDVLEEGINYIIDRYRNNVENYFWLCKILLADVELMERLSIERGKLVFNLFHCLDIISRAVMAKKVGVNKLSRKLFNQVVDFLVKDNVFKEALNIKGLINESDGRKIIAIINGISLLDDKNKAYLSTNIFETFPSLLDDLSRSTRSIHDFLVTKESFDKKQKELQHIVNVEIPNNSKAIGIAKELGDLRENVDYTAALEHQKHLQEMYSRLTEDLSKVKILRRENVKTYVVSPGTRIVLTNLDSNEKEEYVLLGEWESDLEKGIISYKSPFGQALLGNNKGEEFVFEYAGVEKRYRVEDIELAKQITA